MLKRFFTPLALVLALGCTPPPDKSAAQEASSEAAPEEEAAEEVQALTLDECRAAQVNLNRLLGQGINVAAMCSMPEALPRWGEKRWAEVRCFAAAQTLEELEGCGDEGMARLAREAAAAGP